jgi:octaprenyl-diphosphate synthase
MAAPISPSKADGRPLPVAAWEDVTSPVRGFLERVSTRLEEQVSSFEPEIAEYARYALENQGKQLRPALVALSGAAVGPLHDEHVTAAVILEMVHLATLVHDDIMDEARLRRRRATLATKWGNEVAVLLGDCLFARALALAASFPTPDVCRQVARASGIVCTGEILQTHRRRRWNQDRTDYFKVLEMKTAELFAVACRLSAQLAGATPREAAALNTYGLALGTAYQIYDDCLDLYGAETQAGKSLGTDLASGKVTLPLIVCLERATPTRRAEVIQWLENWQSDRLPDLRAVMIEHECLAESCDVIDRFLNTARAALSEVRTGPESHALGSLTDFLAQQTAALVV